MDSKERILTALNNKQPDQVPIFELYINEPVVVKLARLLKPEAVAVETVEDKFGDERLEILDLYCLIIDELALDATSSNFSVGFQDIGQGRCRDKFGSVYSLSEHGESCVLEGPIKEISDIKGFDMVSKLEPEDFSNVQYVISKAGAGKAHFVCIIDPFKLSWRLRGGMENSLLDYLLNPQLAHALARITTDFDLAAIDLAVEAGADAVILPGDLAGEQTTIISPEHYREYIKPYHQEMVDHAHQKGIKIVKHSDGNMWPILDDLIEIGFDGFHPIQPQCMDIAEVKEHVAGKLCILGNIDCRNLLCFGTEKEVEESVKEAIRKAAPGGGYIISSSNSIHPGCKPENYITMVQAAHKYGVYGAG